MFIHENFLLRTAIAQELYHNYAKDLPIIDYHSHLPPDAIAANTNFENITKIWLAGDHYKWRAQRTLGVEERYITGNASDLEKFIKWAEVVPYTVRNPLYHWTHMELKRPFGITELLDVKNAERIFYKTEAQLQQPDFSAQGLLTYFNVAIVGTTDDPADALAAHRSLASSTFKTRVLPSFRPDKVFKIAEGKHYLDYLNQLKEASGLEIRKLDDLLDVMQQRVDYFHLNGCRIADHGLNYIPENKWGKANIDRLFDDVLEGNKSVSLEDQDAFTAFLLIELCKMYHAKKWVQQFHLGALRNNNERMLSKIGPDTGYDSIGDYPQAVNLSTLLNTLEKNETLAKSVIYNLNPADNAVFAAMIGNFQAEGTKGKVQFGSAWWFLDQLDGMKDQMNWLSSVGLISCFIGMLTDSRSFLSYSRHEYFRRLLCNLFADDLEMGLLPHDLAWIGKIIQDICYHNAANYFDLTEN